MTHSGHHSDAPTQYESSPNTMNLSNQKSIATPAWQAGWASLAGLRHVKRGQACEDSIAARAFASGALHVALADGVSNGAMGEVASLALVNHCVAMPETERAENWLQSAEFVVQTALQSITSGRGATTLAAAWLDTTGQACLTRVGDCRIYKIDNGTLSLERYDETFAALGETPPFGVAPENPARMVGIGCMSNKPYEVWHTHLETGQGLLLCSDGVHDVLNAQAITDVLAQYPTESLAKTAHRLCVLAQSLGSQDDVAVLVVVRTC